MTPPRVPEDPFRYRRLFLAAGLYNLLWGMGSAACPQWLFQYAGLETMRHPQIFQCLAMVVGVYGLLYLEVARRPDQGFAIAAIGLLGKVLGPLGWLKLVLSGAWPLKTVVLILTNDLIWWIPFAGYLRATWPHYRESWSPVR